MKIKDEGLQRARCAAASFSLRSRRGHGAPRAGHPSPQGLGLAAAALALGLLCAAPAAALPSFAQVKAAHRPSDVAVLDAHGAVLDSVRVDASVRRLAWVPLADLSPALRAALLRSEDRRFEQHAGVDWQAVGAAAWGALSGAPKRGASTLTMQLVGLLDDDLAVPAGGRSALAKAQQAVQALALERHWRKDQILEAYVNRVPFRGEWVGIAALSQGLFGKAASGLDARESALAVAMLRAPHAPPERIAARACALLEAQQRANDCPALAGLLERALASVPSRAAMGAREQAPHAARLALSQWRAARGDAPPAAITTTLDARTQSQAIAALKQHLAELTPNHAEDGAVVVLDNASGAVLAWVGSAGAQQSQAAAVDGVRARRQAGSTLKPFIYQLALEKRWLTAASLLQDAPLHLPTAAGLYIPENYNHRFEGAVSLRTALAASLNVPAVRAVHMTTPDAAFNRLQAYGLALRESGGYHGHALALGAPEVALIDLTNAYRALANGGQWRGWRLLPQAAAPAHAHAPRDVASAASSFIVADILADANARATTFGLGNVLATRYWAAVKTGTSKDMRDNWCVGFSRRYTVGVWVGNASGAPMWDVSGVSGAAPIWRSVMDALMARSSAADKAAPRPPPGVVRAAVRYAPAVEPPRGDWFITGTEPAPGQPIALVSRASQAASRWIAEPVDGTVLALDPDIPPAAQQLRLAPRAGGVPKGWRWRMDGRILGPATARNWPLWPGPHLLELINTAGERVEALRFEVRGAGVKGAP